jgi:hypothetical protein
VPRSGGLAARHPSGAERPSRCDSVLKEGPQGHEGPGFSAHLAERFGRKFLAS